jgi:hypothetical protein
MEAGSPGGLELPDQALECQAVHGCGRGRPPTIINLIVKVPIRVHFNGRRRLHRVGDLAADQGGGHRVVPGSYRPLRSSLQVPGSPGGCQKGPNAREIAPATDIRLNTGAATSAGDRGSMSLLTAGVPYPDTEPADDQPLQARERRGDRFAPEAFGRSPAVLPPRAGSSSNYPISIPFKEQIGPMHDRGVFRRAPESPNSSVSHPFAHLMIVRLTARERVVTVLAAQPPGADYIRASRAST